ncbi:hypothetical protein F2981_21300 (plasmid) [Sinorhizobium meliloti]|nr:hypothetical protein [Sinorhizobium meliloti]
MPAPGSAKVTVRHESIGVNYTDIYHRTGEYPCLSPPDLELRPQEVIEAIGSGVIPFKVGDRVFMAVVPWVLFHRAHHATERMVKIPDDIDSEKAASLLFKDWQSNIWRQSTL